MLKSELITPDHRARKAVIYIRQSTPQQTLTNQESLRLQYALTQRAVGLGWCEHEVEIIDTDLGMTGTSVQQREGFQTLVAQVTLGQVGIILSTDVTRLSGYWAQATDNLRSQCHTGLDDAIQVIGVMNGP